MGTGADFVSDDEDVLSGEISLVHGEVFFFHSFLIFHVSGLNCMAQVSRILDLKCHYTHIILVFRSGDMNPM